MQTKHRKVTGEEPGARLHEETLSAGEIAELLGLSKQQANVLIRKEKEMPLNWCPSCKAVLSNEEVVDGKCERCHSEVTKKNLRQWMLKITK